MNLFKQHFNPSGNMSIDQNLQWHKQHENVFAIDYPTPTCTEIYAPMDGYVWNFSVNNANATKYFGPHYPVLKDKFGVYHGFAHCSKIIKFGNVKKGDLIALTGNLGNSTGPHVHYFATKNASDIGYGGDRVSSHEIKFQLNRDLYVYSTKDIVAYTDSARTKKFIVPANKRLHYVRKGTQNVKFEYGTKTLYIHDNYWNSSRLKG